MKTSSILLSGVALGAMLVATPALALPPLQSCLQDSDCQSGELCALPEPVCPPCAFIDEDGDGQNDVECPDCTLPSVEGMCIRPAPEPVQCNVDADCKPGEACVFYEVHCPPCAFIDEDGDGQNDVECPPCLGQGICDQAPAPPVSCATDADCDPGLACVIREVCPDCPFIDEDGDGQSDVACPAVCFEQAQCEPVQPEPPGCTSDAQCPAGFMCELRDVPVCDTVCDPSLPGCSSSCGAPAPGQCVPEPEWRCGTEDFEGRWGQPEPEAQPSQTGVGDLLGCQVTARAASPAAPGGMAAALMGLLGVLGLRRRRRA